MTNDWDQAHAEYSLTIRSSIALFEASGTLTRKSAMAALQRFYEVYPNDRPEVTGVVVMYDRCQLQTTMVDLVAIYKDIAAHGLPVDVPLALVVPDWAYGLAKEYCDHQRHSGVIRDAFLCRDAALDWVERQVALLELQRKARGG